VITSAAPTRRIGLSRSCSRSEEAVTATKGSRTNWYAILDAGQNLRMNRTRTKTRHEPRSTR
jgi:hypothetical protein